jgi:hypothetical protein
MNQLEEQAVQRISISTSSPIHPLQAPQSTPVWQTPPRVNNNAPSTSPRIVRSPYFPQTSSNETQSNIAKVSNFYK